MKRVTIEVNPSTYKLSNLAEQPKYNKFNRSSRESTRVVESAWEFQDKHLNSYELSICPGLMVFTCENSYRCEFHTGMTRWFYAAFTWRDNFPHIPHPTRHHLGLDDQNYTCATRSSLPGDCFHIETSGRSSFTWYWWEFSYRNENLDQVQWLGWAHTGMTRSGMSHVNEYRARKGNQDELVPVWLSYQ